MWMVLEVRIAEEKELMMIQKLKYSLSLFLLILSLAVSLSYSAKAATITVDSGGDAALPSNDGNCTLREAIKAANDDTVIDSCVTGSGADIIVFDSSVSAITIVASDLDEITESLAIQGPGSDELLIDGSNLWKLFIFDSSTNDQEFEISGVKLYNSTLAAGIDDGETVNIQNVIFEENEHSFTAAIYVYASTSADITHLTVKESRFVGNNNTGFNGGGAISANINSIVEIRDSEFSKNTAASGGGAIGMSCTYGGQLGDCSLTIKRSTFSGNESIRGGGAISASAGDVNSADVKISATTISGNVADADSENTVDHNGGGIFLRKNTTLTISNSILAGNADNSTTGEIFNDIAVAGTTNAVTSLGQSIIGNNLGADTEFPAGMPNVKGDYVGTSTSSLDPLLGALSDNGGFTLSYLPLVGSPAIDNGLCGAIHRDQRGFSNSVTGTRIVDDAGVVNGAGSDGCDIGSIEVGAVSSNPPSPAEEGCYVIKSLAGSTIVFCL